MKIHFLMNWARDPIWSFYMGPTQLAKHGNTNRKILENGNNDQGIVNGKLRLEPAFKKNPVVYNRLSPISYLTISSSSLMQSECNGQDIYIFMLLTKNPGDTSANYVPSEN